MPIVMDSSQWTGQQDDAPMASPVVWGEFAEAAEIDRVAERLQAESWFHESQAGSASAAAEPGTADNEDQVDAPDDDPKGADRRNLRQNFVGIGTAASSMAAAGIVIATGGAALPAVAAAAAAGGAALAAGEAAGAAVPETGTGRRPADQAALRAEGPALGITVGTQALREKAEAFLQQAGAKRVWVQETPAG